MINVGLFYKKHTKDFSEREGANVNHKIKIVAS